jgi:glycosyltransferase involved in cell wall biosynthesis
VGERDGAVRIQGAVDNNVWPPRMGVTVRVWNLYQGLTRRPEVAAVSIVAALKSRESAVEREEREGVTIVRVKPWHPTLFAWLERAGIAPLSLAAEGHRRLPGLVAHAFDPHADVLEVDSLNLTPLLASARPGVLRVYGAQNVEAEWFERVGSDVARKPGWAKRLTALEREALERADLVVAVSAADKASFVERYGVTADKIAVVDNGFDATRLRAPSSDEKAGARAALGLAGGERGLLFLGTDFAHNRQAAEDLFRVVVPRLEDLGARLFLVGGVSTSFRARAGERVRAVPEQADLTPYLWGADVGLNPITTGAGSNVKLPTYLAAGLDVVSTPFGMRGFDRLAPFVTVSEMDAFADALAQPPASRAGRDAALAAYSWAAQSERLYEAYAARRAGLAVTA